MKNLTPNRTPRRAQAGMTLIELTVVLLVLIGLAGLLIPYVSGFAEKTHDSTGDNNLASLNNTIQRFQGQYMSYPDNLHSLIETGGTNVYGGLMNTALVENVTYTADGAAAVATTEIPLDSLMKAGISSVYDMKDDASNGSKTFDAANAQVSVPMATGTGTGSVNLARITAGGAVSVVDHLADAFGVPATYFNTSCYDYLAFGIGQESEMTGLALTDAPVHFASNGDMGPQNKYNRFVAVFEVDKDNTTAGCSTSTDRAKFVGTAMLMGEDHLWGLAHSLDHTYENMAER